MPADLAVIIPSWNEESSIASAVASAWEAGASEVVVADGGSEDATVAVAHAGGARVVESDRMRGRQMNLGARATVSDVLLFLHADTLLPPRADHAVVAALDQGFLFGGFSLSFIEHHARMRLAARMINARARLTRSPWGDQAQFLRRATFESAGGFREVPLMEDYDMARRMRRAGRVAILDERVRTSGRRFLEKGLLATAAINWSVIAAFHLGVDPARLARFYAGSTRR